MELCFAPMDGITTCATRLITQEVFEKYGNTSDTFQLWTEFMNVDGFLINPRKVIKHLMTNNNQKPIAQIYGGKSETLLEASKKIQSEYSHLFAGIELNTGCPSNTVMKVGGGSDMMKNRDNTMKIIQQLSEITKIGGLPFSIKARAGINDEDKKDQLRFLVEASQFCSIISIHGRTLKQLYLGEADWEFIQKVKKEILKKGNPNCKIIGNGGITNYQQAQEFANQFEVDGIMVGQGAIGNPRIFTPHKPNNEEKLECILRHFELTVACDQYFEEVIEHGEGKIGNQILIPDGWLKERIEENNKNINLSPHSLVEFRKFLFQYIKGIPDSRGWKQEILQIKEYQKMIGAIQNFFDKILI